MGLGAGFREGWDWGGRVSGEEGGQGQYQDQVKYKRGGRRVQTG